MRSCRHRLPGAYAFAAALLLVPINAPAFQADELLPADDCASCHSPQYSEWTLSAHASHPVQCYECHGPFHSAELHGCRRCHQAVHGDRIRHWPAVRRFTEGDAADYACIVCHDAHNLRLRKSLVGCYACHGSQAHGIASDWMHAHLASTITPVHMDEFARERDGLIPRLMSMPRAQAATIALALMLMMYVVLALLAFPFTYTAYAAWCALGRRGGASAASTTDSP
jgi:hypothetical protein